MELLVDSGPEALLRSPWEFSGTFRVGGMALFRRVPINGIGTLTVSSEEGLVFRPWGVTRKLSVPHDMVHCEDGITMAKAVICPPWVSTFMRRARPGDERARRGARIGRRRACCRSPRTQHCATGTMGVVGPCKTASRRSNAASSRVSGCQSKVRLAARVLRARRNSSQAWNGVMPGNYRPTSLSSLWNVRLVSDSRGWLERAAS